MTDYEGGEMSREDIIRMAREAGFMAASHPMNPWSAHTDQIERFAALVAAYERGEFEAKLIEKVASNTWSFQPTKWVGLDEYIKNRFQERIKEENQTDLEIMAMVEHFLKVNNSGVGD
jgi:hypothetical protein